MWSEAGSYIHQGLGLSSLVSTQYKSFYRVRVDRIGVQAPKGVLSNTGGLQFLLTLAITGYFFSFPLNDSLPGGCAVENL